MASLATQNDYYNRLQRLLCYIGAYGSLLSSKLRIGSSCECDINTLEILTMYWSTLECWSTEDPQCLLQTDIDLIWESVSKITGICFAPYGSTYSGTETLVYRITENDFFRETEEGILRVIEDGINSQQFNDGIDYMYITTGTPEFIVR